MTGDLGFPGENVFLAYTIPSDSPGLNCRSEARPTLAQDPCTEPVLPCASEKRASRTSMLSVKVLRSITRNLKHLTLPQVSLPKSAKLCNAFLCLPRSLLCHNCQSRLWPNTTHSHYRLAMVYFLPDVAVPETTCSAQATVSGKASDVATGARNPLLSNQSMPWSSAPFFLHLTSPHSSR